MQALKSNESQKSIITKTQISNNYHNRKVLISLNDRI